jgi:hypothetical protein
MLDQIEQDLKIISTEKASLKKEAFFNIVI